MDAAEKARFWLGSFRRHPVVRAAKCKETQGRRMSFVAGALELSSPNVL